jgi:hypothetical protein
MNNHLMIECLDSFSINCWVCQFVDEQPPNDWMPWLFLNKNIFFVINVIERKGSEMWQNYKFYIKYESSLWRHMLKIVR